MSQGGRHVRSRRTYRLDPTDERDRSAPRRDHRNRLDDYDEEPPKRYASRGEAHDSHRRDDHKPRRSSAPARRYDRWDDEGDSATNADYDPYAKAGRRWTTTHASGTRQASRTAGKSPTLTGIQTAASAIARFAAAEQLDRALARNNVPVGGDATQALSRHATGADRQRGRPWRDTPVWTGTRDRRIHPI